jgi:hypothetical protein
MPSLGESYKSRESTNMQANFSVWSLVEHALRSVIAGFAPCLDYIDKFVADMLSTTIESLLVGLFKNWMIKVCMFYCLYRLYMAVICYLYWSDDELSNFVSVENALCTNCRPELRNLEMPSSIAQAKFLAPSRCQMCSYIPSYYPFVACTVKIDNSTHQCLVNFTELKKVKDARDIHGPLINNIDAKPSQDFNMHLFQALLPKIIALQRRVLPYGMVDKWTGNRRYCDHFRPIAAAPTPLYTTIAQGVFNRMRKIWDFVSLHGTYPVTTVLAGPRTVFNSLARQPAPDMTMHAQIVEEQAELNAAASPGPGETSGFVPDEAAHVTGPIVVPTTILNPKHVSHGAEVRTQVQTDPRTGQPLKMDRKTATAIIFHRFWAKISKELLSRERVTKIFAKIMGGKQLGEYGLSKFSENAINDALASNMMIRSPEDIKMRIANGKWEGISKDGKTVRIVMDNGIELMTMVHVFGEVFTEAIFGEDSPFYGMNIKHQDRAACLDQFVKFNAQDFGEPMIMWEVDQTSMEAHMRVPGALEPVLRAVQNIANTVCQKFSGQLGSRYSSKIGYDIDKGMRVSIEVRGVAVPGSTKKAVLRFPDFYLDSGWMLTSAANFAGECTATMSCFCEDPWHIFARNEAGAFRINDGNKKESFPPKSSFDYTYQSRPFPTALQAWTPTRIKFNALIEGDDGSGGASRKIVGEGSLSAIAATKQQLTYYMADLGMSAKFELVINGRVEIIGAHMKAVDGRLDTSFPWCPDVKRYLGKIGVATQSRQPTSEEGRTILAASRMISIASMFRGNIEVLYNAFTNLATYHYRKLSKVATMKLYRVDAWSAEEMAGVKAGLTSLKSTFETMEEKGSSVVYPVHSTQELMILNSLKMHDPGYNMMAKLDIWSQDLMDWDGDHEAYYRQLPEILKF